MNAYWVAGIGSLCPVGIDFSLRKIKHVTESDIDLFVPDHDLPRLTGTL
jgi:hypothetical protein